MKNKKNDKKKNEFERVEQNGSLSSIVCKFASTKIIAYNYLELKVFYLSHKSQTYCISDFTGT